MKTLLIVLFVILVGVGGFYFGSKYQVVPTAGSGVPTPTAMQVVETPTVMPTTISTPSASPTVDEKQGILMGVKAGLIAEHGASAGNMVITVSKIDGNFATGGATEEGGGGMWLAAKVGGAWKLAWDGNGTIGCDKVNPYNFPTSMVPECWDEAKQDIVTR